MLLLLLLLLMRVDWFVGIPLVEVRWEWHVPREYGFESVHRGRVGVCDEFNELAFQKERQGEEEFFVEGKHSARDSQARAHVVRRHLLETYGRDGHAGHVLHREEIHGMWNGKLLPFQVHKHLAWRNREPRRVKERTLSVNRDVQEEASRVSRRTQNNQVYGTQGNQSNHWVIYRDTYKVIYDLTLNLN